MLAIKRDPVPLQVDARGTVRVGGTRVTLETVIGAFNRGASPDEIAASFPTVNLGDIYAVIGYYLRHRAEVDAYLESAEREAAAMRHQIESQPGYAALRDRALTKRRSNRSTG
jgi:uncharacterized protein (DUF433 family)